MTCKICKRPLIGLINEYGYTCICSDCCEDKKEVLSCETGCKVKAINLDDGMSYDSEQAKKHLTENKVYTSKEVIVGCWSSTIELDEIPNEKFNTIHFVRV